MAGKREPRMLKELRSLMPWNWDARVDVCPPGSAALRDFQEVFKLPAKDREAHPTSEPGAEGRAAEGRNREGAPHRRAPALSAAAARSPSRC